MKRFFILLLAAGCGPAKPPMGPPPPQPVTVIKPVTTSVQQYYEYNGTLDAVSSVKIEARVEGFLTDVRFTDGEEVKAGDPLYTIDPREFQSAVARSKSDIARAAADVENAKAQIELARAELNRIVAGGATFSKSDRDKATATLAANQAQLEVATANKGSAQSALTTANLKLSYTDIRAPIDGRIGRTLVTPGNLVGQKEATLLTTIVSTDPMYVYFDVPERDLSAYQKLLQQDGGKDAALPLEVGLGSREGYPHRGMLNFQDNHVEAGTGTIRIRGSLPNRLVPWKVRPLYAGLYVRVRVPAGSARPLLAIPEDALMTGQEGRFVYLIGPDNVIQKRSVVVGPPVWRASAEAKQPAWTLTNPNPDGKVPPTAPVRSVVSIESGLAAGDRIVAIGLLRARPGVPVVPEDWDFRAPTETRP